MKTLANAAAAIFLAFATSTALALVSLDPADFPLGTDVSMEFDSVVLSTVEASAEAFNTTIVTPLRQVSMGASPIYAASDAFSRLTFRASWSAGCCGMHNALRIDFLGFATELIVQFLPDDIDSGLLALFGPNGEVLGDLIGESQRPFALVTRAQEPRSPMLWRHLQIPGTSAASSTSRCSRRPNLPPSPYSALAWSASLLRVGAG